MADMEKEYVGIAGEYAVASELCRRNMYAQLTFGTRKRTDILVYGKTGMLRIEVKAKQWLVWPMCKGICGQNVALVFVDFRGKYKDEEYKRPDFYILTAKEWRNLLEEGFKGLIAAHDMHVNDENTPIFVRNINKQGKPSEGITVKVSHVADYKEDWDKITNMLNA